MFFRLVVFACLLFVQGGTLWAQTMPLSQVVLYSPSVADKGISLDAHNRPLSKLCILSYILS